MYDEKLDKYHEKKQFFINIDYINKNINIFTFDKTIILNIDSKKRKIYGYKYIDKYDTIYHKQCSHYIIELINNINKNFNNIINLEKN